MDNRSNKIKKDSIRQRIQFINFQIVIIILISICIVCLMSLSNYKINKIFESHRESLLTTEFGSSELNEKLADAIIEFRPDMCKMIEIYSTDFDLIMKMKFDPSDDRENNDPAIENFPELMNLLRINNEGNTTIRTEDEEEDVYFRHVTLSSGEECVIIIYMTRTLVKHIWLINFLGYFTLLLVFVLLIHSMHLRQKDTINYYKMISKDVRDRMIH